MIEPYVVFRELGDGLLLSDSHRDITPNSSDNRDNRNDKKSRDTLT